MSLPGRDEALECVAALDEDPGARRATDRHRDRKRRRERERAGTRDDEQRDRVIDRTRRVGEVPPDERRGRKHEDDPNEPRRKAIRRLDDWRASPCAFFDLAHDLSDARCLTGLRDLDVERRRDVECSRIDVRSRRHRAERDSPVSSETLTCELPAFHDAVGGERLARTNGEHHARHDRL